MRLFLKILVIALFLFTNLGWIWQNPVVRKNREGNKLYSEGDVDEALSKWRDAQIESPDKKELHYNIGGALHEQKKYEDSFTEYEKALDTKDAELQAKTYYNMGNTHYRMGRLSEAIEDYERCLEITPDDEDAKYNIELIRKKIKENLKKQQTSQEERQQQQGEESQPQQQERGRKEGKEEKETEEEQQAARDKEQGAEGEEEKEEVEQEDEKEGAEQQANDEKEMSKEDAVRLLDALKDDEQDLQRELRLQPGEGRYRIDKDW